MKCHDKGIEDTKMKLANPRIMRDADQIVHRLRTTEVTQAALMAEYHCGHAAMMAAVLRRITKRQWRAIARKKLAQGGITGRFKPGHETWNAGMKGWCPPGSEATWFKIGVLRGQAARNYRPVGMILIVEGTKKWSRRKRQPRRFIKVREDGPTGQRWIPYARYLWEKDHGPIPKGWFVVHRDGDSMNDDIHNLILVDRREHMRRLHQRPEVMRKCRQRAGEATKKRHAMNRTMKDSGFIQKVKRFVWDCGSCGEEVRSGTPKCPKCGSLIFEKREILDMPDSMLEEAIGRVFSE